MWAAHEHKKEDVRNVSKILVCKPEEEWPVEASVWLL